MHSNSKAGSIRVVFFGFSIFFQYSNIYMHKAGAAPCGKVASCVVVKSIT